MSGFFEALFDAFIDSIKILPILLIIYFLIEFLEYKNALKFQNSRLLKGKANPVIGALFGCIPQCGFSVVTTDLYTKKAVSIGALIAVYLATSDEALPIMLSEPNYILDLLLLIGCKLLLGIIIGYLAIFLYGKFFVKNEISQINEVHSHKTKESRSKLSENQHIDITEEYINSNEQADPHGCCHHNIQAKKFEWRHPLIHSIKIFAYILIVNIILGIVIYFIGEDNFINFLQSSFVFQPLLAVIIGLIPNCAASVLITELYIAGGLSFGSILAGLCVNSGIAIILLLKQNKNYKENIFIFSMLIIPSLVVGYALHFITIL